MKKLIAGLITISCFLLCSCSTVINTTTQDIDIKSNPANAKITIDGKKFGITPQKVNIERSKNHLIKIELDGYDTYETQLTTKISSWYWLNILNGFIPGGLIDMITGSMYRLLPEQLNIELQAIKAPVKKK